MLNNNIAKDKEVARMKMTAPINLDRAMHCELLTSYKDSFCDFGITHPWKCLFETNGTEFIFGGEAKRVCEAYKRLCPAKKICALQTIHWPAPMKFPVCVHEKHLVVKSKICRKAPVHGKCGAKFMRWYFNVHMGACSWFTYSGCGGNQNNFRTSEECEARCMGVDKSIYDERSSEGINVENENDLTTVDAKIPREPKFHPAPEMIEMDKSDIRASLLTDEHHRWSKDRKKTKSKVNIKKQQKKGKKKKTNGKKVKKLKHNGQDSQAVLLSTAMTHSEWTVENASASVFELKTPQTGYHWEDNSKKSPVWQIDTRFSRDPSSSKRRHPINNRMLGIDNQLNLKSKIGPYFYYDKVQMFEILKKNGKT
ncbi:hypothetical protein Btru_054223 [Bulinus truncatus]|nr:hypothetical protein Btru_054223 [Bulinus truncatus]